MVDIRDEQLARVALNHSVKLNSDDKLLVCVEQEFMGIYDALAKQAEEIGADVVIYQIDLEHERAITERADKKELQDESERLCEITRNCTARIRVDADSDLEYLSGVDPTKIALYGEVVTSPLLDIVCGDGKDLKKKKWLVLGYPSKENAREAGMSLDSYADFVYSAAIRDWDALGKEMAEVKDAFDDAEQVRIYVPGQTDLTLSLKGRGGEICDGQHNMPDGEVFYGPVEDSAEGKIYFPYECIRDGNRVKGITLEYKAGEVVNFSAEKGEDFLKAQLALDGVKRIGELGLGCNYGIKEYINHLLFDEKIGGTIHIAIGESYFEPLSAGGGLNKAPIHWDLVCDLRQVAGQPGGELYVNEKLVQRNGIWLFD